MFYGKKFSREVDAFSLGDEFAGYVLRNTGGNDKQGVLLHRVRPLSDGHSCYRTRRTCERKRKSVRCCIVSPDIAALSLVVVRHDDAPIPGLTEDVFPKRVWPKGAIKTRRFFNLTKEDDPRRNPTRSPTPRRRRSSASSPPGVCSAAVTSALSTASALPYKRSPLDDVADTIIQHARKGSAPSQIGVQLLRLPGHPQLQVTVELSTFCHLTRRTMEDVAIPFAAPFTIRSRTPPLPFVFQWRSVTRYCTNPAASAQLVLQSPRLLGLGCELVALALCGTLAFAWPRTPPIASACARPPGRQTHGIRTRVLPPVPR
ncbi:hypothetical protein AURDEDRAFT_128883 [Auricularia subglabra TFB-10046 SS5]|nr:hypothetical protein AURDEDRAFT_128883 [Auricularia subglabra TFB-10046 SS5]